ncbi:MAG: ubiquitin-like small modifier protein 1 [Halobacteria archaeon]
MARSVNVHLLASLAETAGTDEVALELPDGEFLVLDVLEKLVSEYPSLKTKIYDEDVYDGNGEASDVENSMISAHINLVVNGESVDPEKKVGDSDEVAVFPPVSGG